MPLMIVCPESSSVRTLKVGSSSASRDRATPIFSWSALVLGLDGHRDDRIRKGNGAQGDGVMRRAERIAGFQLFHSHAGADVASHNLADVFALVGVHLDQPADALVLPVRGLSTVSPVLSEPE